MGCLSREFSGINLASNGISVESEFCVFGLEFSETFRQLRGVVMALLEVS